MSANRRRYDALLRLAQDPAATPAERKLAAERAEHVRRQLGGVVPDDLEVEVPDELLAAFGRSMTAASRVSSRAFRDARTRAARRRAGRDAVRQWEDGRGPGLAR